MVLLVATMSPIGVAAAAGADEDKLLVSIKGIVIPSLSPDWEKVAYISWKQNGGDVKVELWLMDIDGSNLKKLDEWIGYESRCAIQGWHPDGKKILYWIHNRDVTSNKEDPRMELWVVNSDGTGKKRIAEDAGGAIWSPDGSKIAFQTIREGICVVNSDDSNKKLITSGMLLSWSPDSKRIIFGNYEGIREIDVESGVENVLNATISTEYISISPDASKIVYYHHTYRPYGIYVSNIDGSDLKQLTYNEYDFPCCWSPDSKRIVFISGEKGTIREGIWVMNFDGSDQKKIAKRGYKELVSGGFSVFGSKDGSKIAYAIWENETTNIYTINVDKPSLVKPPTEKQPGITGFEVIFAIAGILVMAYLLRRKE